MKSWIHEESSTLVHKSHAVKEKSWSLKWKRINKRNHCGVSFCWCCVQCTTIWWAARIDNKISIKENAERWLWYEITEQKCRRAKIIDGEFLLIKNKQISRARSVGIYRECINCTVFMQTHMFTHCAHSLSVPQLFFKNFFLGTILRPCRTILPAPDIFAQTLGVLFVGIWPTGIWFPHFLCQNAYCRTTFNDIFMCS